MKRLTLFAAFVMTAFGADAALLNLPAVAIIAPTSGSIVCSEVGGAGSIHPGAPSTVVFNCTVSPATWSGTVTVTNNKFVVQNLVGTTFDVAIGAAAIAPGTISAGTLTSTP